MWDADSDIMMGWIQMPFFQRSYAYWAGWNCYILSRWMSCGNRSYSRYLLGYRDGSAEMRERGAEDDAGGRHDQGALADCRGPASWSQRAVAPSLHLCLHTHTVDTTWLVVYYTRVRCTWCGHGTADTHRSLTDCWLTDLTRTRLSLAHNTRGPEEGGTTQPPAPPRRLHKSRDM